MSATIRRAILYGVLALCLCGFAYVQGRSDESASVTFSEANAILGGHAGYRRVIDSLRGAEARFVGLEGYWRARADSLGGIQRTTAVANSPAGADSTPHLANSQPVNDSLRVIFLGRALDACDASRGLADSALARCAARGDSLERSLRAVLAVKSCRVLFIPCPSRSAFFVVGALAGALLDHRLSH